MSERRKQREALIKYKRDFEPDKIIDVKLEKRQEDGSTMKISVKAIDGESVEATLSGIREFREACALLEWEEAQLLFSGFRRVLRGNAKDDWDSARMEHEETVEGFQASLRSFKEAYISPKDRRIQKYYIESLFYVNNVTVRVHANRLKNLVRLLTEFPGDDTIIITDQERKQILYDSMPEEMQRAWTIAGKDLDSSTFQEIIQYFEDQRALGPRRTNNNSERKRKNNDNSGFNNYDQKNRRGSRYSNEKQQRRSSSPLTNDSICPIHGKHTWGECFDNKNGPSYRPPRGYAKSSNSSNNSSNRRGSGGYQGPTHQQHYQSSDRRTSSNSHLSQSFYLVPRETTVPPNTVNVNRQSQAPPVSVLGAESFYIQNSERQVNLPPPPHRYYSFDNLPRDNANQAYPS